MDTSKGLSSSVKGEFMKHIACEMFMLSASSFETGHRSAVLKDSRYSGIHVLPLSKHFPSMIKIC